MKNRNRMWSLLLVLVLCISQMLGCAATSSGEQVKQVTPLEKEKSNAVSYSFIGGKDVMPLQGFYGPYAAYRSADGNVLPDYFDEKYFKLIAEAGINVINYSDASYTNVPEQIEKALDLCEKYGMGYYVLDNRVSTNDGKPGEQTVNAALLGEYIADYSDHPAFCGVFLIDEPRTGYYMPGNEGQKDISRHGELAKTLQYDLGLMCYINAFPLIAGQQSTEPYEKYIAEYCDTMKPKYLMWDHYPFYPKQDADDLDEYFYNMSLAREHAQKNEIPFWAAIQAGSQWNDEHINFDSKVPYFPDESHFNWNVNTCLAFGVQGLTYFPLIQPEHFAWAESTPYDTQRNGVIGIFGNKTQWYYYIQNINRHIAVIDEVLMNSVNKGVIINGEQAEKDMELTNCVIETGKFQELMSVSGDAMVGCFNYNGKTALYVVNYSTKYAQHITLNLNDTHEIEKVQNAKTSHVKAKELTLDMAAGEGVLLVIK